MKKLITVLSLSSFLLLACGDQDVESEEESVEESTDYEGTIVELENRIVELETENEELVQENQEMVNFVEEYLTDMEESIEEAPVEESNNNFTLNTSIEFSSGEIVTVTSIEESNIELREIHEGEQAVVVTATIENPTSSPLSFNAQTFDLYDGNQELGRFDASTYRNNIPNSIAAGMNATVEVHFSVKSESPYFVTYGDAVWQSE